MPALRLHSWGAGLPTGGVSWDAPVRPLEDALKGARGARLFRTAGWSHGVREGQIAAFRGQGWALCSMEGRTPGSRHTC